MLSTEKMHQYDPDMSYEQFAGVPGFGRQNMMNENTDNESFNSSQFHHNSFHQQYHQHQHQRQPQHQEEKDIIKENQEEMSRARHPQHQHQQQNQQEIEEEIVVTVEPDAGGVVNYDGSGGIVDDGGGGGGGGGELIQSPSRGTRGATAAAARQEQQQQPTPTRGRGRPRRVSSAIQQPTASTVSDNSSNQPSPSNNINNNPPPPSLQQTAVAPSSNNVQIITTSSSGRVADGVVHPHATRSKAGGAGAGGAGGRYRVVKISNSNAADIQQRHEVMQATEAISNVIDQQQQQQSPPPQQHQQHIIIQQHPQIVPPIQQQQQQHQQIIPHQQQQQQHNDTSLVKHTNAIQHDHNDYLASASGLTQVELEEEVTVDVEAYNAYQGGQTIIKQDNSHHQMDHHVAAAGLDRETHMMEEFEQATLQYEDGTTEVVSAEELIGMQQQQQQHQQQQSSDGGGGGRGRQSSGSGARRPPKRQRTYGRFAANTGPAPHLHKYVTYEEFNRQKALIEESDMTKEEKSKERKRVADSFEKQKKTLAARILSEQANQVVDLLVAHPEVLEEQMTQIILNTTANYFKDHYGKDILKEAERIRTATKYNPKLKHGSSLQQKY